MIYLYGNNCTTCLHILKILTSSNVPYKYTDFTGKSLTEIKQFLGEDYEPGLRFPIIYENDKLIHNIHSFVRRFTK